MARPQGSPQREPREIRGAAGGPPPSSIAEVQAIRDAVLAWYGPRPHDYPWRSHRPDPYAVLVSEVMLQQTQAARVAPIYRRFLERFPDVRALSSAARAEVLRAWEGLGYHRRALALREAASVIVRDHGAAVPGDPAALQALPGIGPYTAAAVASIAFGEPVAAVDTNVWRIAARLIDGVEPGQIHPRRAWDVAQALLDRSNPGAWNQAMMDLGRFVCRPAPRCDGCPVRDRCRFARSGREPGEPARRQAPFDGSSRQARGRVLAVLRDRGGATLGEIADVSGLPAGRVVAAARALATDGIITLAEHGTGTRAYACID